MLLGQGPTCYIAIIVLFEQMLPICLVDHVMTVTFCLTSDLSALRAHSAEEEFSELINVLAKTALNTVLDRT